MMKKEEVHTFTQEKVAPILHKDEVKKENARRSEEEG